MTERARAKLTVEQRFQWLVDTLAPCRELATPALLRPTWRALPAHLRMQSEL